MWESHTRFPIIFINLKSFCFYSRLISMFAVPSPIRPKKLMGHSSLGFWPILSPNPYGQGDWNIIELLPGKIQPSPVVRTQQAMPGIRPSEGLSSLDTGLQPLAKECDRDKGQHCSGENSDRGRRREGTWAEANNNLWQNPQKSVISPDPPAAPNQVREVRSQGQAAKCMNTEDKGSVWVTFKICICKYFSFLSPCLL